MRIFVARVERSDTREVDVLGIATLNPGYEADLLLLLWERAMRAR